MPPKGSSRGRGGGTGRGRGRGRGRGDGSVADASSGAPNSTIGGDEGVATTEQEDVPMPDISAAETEAPTQSEAVIEPTVTSAEPVGSENAVAPSTSANASPVARESLSRSGSLRDSTTATTPTVIVRGGRRLLAQPKGAIRRSKEDRTALEASQSLRRTDSVPNVPIRGDFRGRGSFSRGRGTARGGFMGDTRGGRGGNIASGPFSAGTATADVAAKRRGYVQSGVSSGGSRSTGGGTTFGSGSGPGTQPSAGRSSGTIKKEGGESSSRGFIQTIPLRGDTDSSDEEDDGGKRKDIDTINLVSSDEEETTTTKPRTAGPLGLPPVRVNRVQHKDRYRPTNVDQSQKGDEAGSDGAAPKRSATEGTAARKGSKGKQKAKDVEIVETERRFRGMWEDSESEGEMEVKPEPADDGPTEGLVSTAPPAPEKPAAPDSGRPTSPRTMRSRARRAAGPEFQTDEERREAEGHELNLQILRTELGALSTDEDGEKGKTATDKEGDVPMTDDGVAPATKRQDRVYLFQFPPILPDLKVTTVKPEPLGSPDLLRKAPPADINGSAAPDTTAETKLPPPAAANADVPIKVEEDEQKVDEGKNFVPKLASGAVGKLRIHASGRATLDWGGTALQMAMGTDVQFLQDVIVAKFNGGGSSNESSDGGDKGAVRGEAMGLGQIRGKFVVTPDWQEIL